MPWIFLSLMIVNAIYFGGKFIEGGLPRSGVDKAEISQMQGRELSLLGERHDLAQQNNSADSFSDREGVEKLDIAAAAQYCFNVGPFESEALAKKFAFQMRAEGFNAALQMRKTEETDFWVFIPPFTNREKAEERLRDLKARGVHGFVVRDGAFINAISLNHFSQKELAQSFLLQMQAAGVPVESRQIKSSRAEYWVYLASGHSGKGLRAALEGFSGPGAALKRESAACEE